MCNSFKAYITIIPKNGLYTSQEGQIHQSHRDVLLDRARRKLYMLCFAVQNTEANRKRLHVKLKWLQSFWIFSIVTANIFTDLNRRSRNSIELCKLQCVEPSKVDLDFVILKGFPGISSIHLDLFFPKR